MNRKQTICALMTICERFAKRYNLTIISKRASENGLWDNTDFTGFHKTIGEYLTGKYGKMEETHFTNIPMDEYDLRKDFKVSFEYRFSSPKICVGTQWGDDGFACIELDPKDKGNDCDYQISQGLFFNENGKKYLNTLIRDWHDIRKEYGENPFDWNGGGCDD